MSKPDQPPVKVSATATRVYRFDPDERRIVKDWDGRDVVALSVVIKRDESGKTTAKCEHAVRFKADGSVGKQAAAASGFYGTSTPAWVRELMDDMPTPKVTLTPPRKASR